MTVAGGCDTRPACKSAGLCKMVFGGSIIGAAVGWFLIVACLSRLDLDLGATAETLRSASSSSEVAEIRQQLTAAGVRLQDVKSALQTHTLVAALGVVLLTIFGAIVLNCGAKAVRSAQAASPGSSDGGCTGSTGGPDAASGPFASSTVA
ncbi:MAG: hypothetical protein HYY25_07230 [Candidatus Wallbacteria bacterium]|nr:hypothetical protein [Candidatus Wallbacteria bacterium]